MAKTIGLTMGKFLPFHKGHELLLKTAYNMCDLLVVLIGTSDDDLFSFEQRKDWIINSINDPEYGLFIINQKELDKNAPKDKNGTITDPKYWDEWIKDTLKLLFLNGFKKDGMYYPTHVFTSDLYGERVAKELDMIWVPVDPNRETIHISGTEIRNNPVENFNYLPQYVKADLAKKVAIIGPESTGKSTLAKHLANKFKCGYVPEYGRTLAEARKNKLTKKDFEIIFKTQDFFLRNALNNLGDVPLVISDTEAITTEVWYEHFFSSVCDKHKSDFDLYILLAPTTPFIQDGTRITNETGRWNMFSKLKNELVKRNKRYYLITFPLFDSRTYEAGQIVEKVLQGEN